MPKRKAVLVWDWLSAKASSSNTVAPSVSNPKKARDRHFGFAYPRPKIYRYCRRHRLRLNLRLSLHRGRRRIADLGLGPDPILDQDLALVMAPMVVAERQELLQPILSNHLKHLLPSLRPPPTRLFLIKINGPPSRRRFFPDHCLMPMQASKKTKTKIREPILKS